MSHFLDQKTEAQEHETTFLRPHTWEVAELGLEPGKVKAPHPSHPVAWESGHLLGKDAILTPEGALVSPWGLANNYQIPAANEVESSL